MKKIYFISLLIVMCLITGCNDKNLSQLTQRDDGVPCSDWGVHPAGSAKYLDEKSIVVSIYVHDKNASWNKRELNRTKKNLRLACEYLVDQGVKYGKKVELIYDIVEYPELEYNFVYDDAASYDLVCDESKDMKNAVKKYIQSEIDTKYLMEKFDSNSIAYLVFIDGEVDSCVSQQYYYNIKDDYEEIAFIGIKWEAGEYIYPDTYAHEMLHLFGAKDLYYARPAVGTSKEFVDYVANKYSKDIMLGNAADVYIAENFIFSEISNITAYNIGWVEYIYEIDLFPEIKNAVLSATTYDFDKHQDVSEEYTIEQRTKYLYVDIVYGVLLIYISLSVVRFVRLEIKRRKALADIQIIGTDGIAVEELNESNNSISELTDVAYGVQEEDN